MPHLLLPFVSTAKFDTLELLKLLATQQPNVSQQKLIDKLLAASNKSCRGRGQIGGMGSMQKYKLNNKYKEQQTKTRTAFHCATQLLNCMQVSGKHADAGPRWCDRIVEFVCYDETSGCWLRFVTQNMWVPQQTLSKLPQRMSTKNLCREPIQNVFQETLVRRAGATNDCQVVTSSLCFFQPHTACTDAVHSVEYIYDLHKINFPFLCTYHQLLAICSANYWSHLVGDSKRHNVSTKASRCYQKLPKSNESLIPRIIWA